MATVVSTSLPARRRSRSGVRAWIVAATATMLLASSGLFMGSAAASSPLGDPAVIGKWNLIAQTTLLGDVTKKPQEHFLYLAFLNIAMYDAVVGIHGRYQPYALHSSPAADASDEAGRRQEQRRGGRDDPGPDSRTRPTAR